MVGFYKSFVNSARKNPLNTSIIYVDNNQIYRKITYKELTQTVYILSKCFEKYLIHKSCIGIMLQSNLYLPAAILSLHKLNFAFYCIDPFATDFSILNLIGIKYILTSNVSENLFLSLNCIKLDCIENIEILEIKNVMPIYYENISYVVQTSGTTGENKIIKVLHECINSNIDSLREIFKINDKDVIYFGTSITFDPFIIEIMLALTSSATLFIVDKDIKNNKSLLLKILFIEKPGITFLQTVPSLFLSFSEKYIDLILSGQTNLQTLALGGENFPINLLNYDLNIKIFNLYGITEISCWASVEKIKKQCDVSLGTILKDTLFQIRDDDNKILNSGEGELFIGSKTRICLINNEKLQNEIVYRQTGDIVNYNKKTNKYFYISRKNDVIKRFGIKINLSHLNKLIYEITQLLSINIWDKSKLILFIILQENDNIIKERIIDKLRIKLLHNLPAESNPDSIEIIPAIPVTTNGKLDKKTLLEIAKLSNFNSVCPRKSASNIFEKLYSKYFGLSKFQIDMHKTQSFLDIGGNSILAIQIISEFDSIVKNNYSVNLMTLLLDQSKCYSNYISLINDHVNEYKNVDSEEGTSIKQRKLNNYNNENVINKNDLKLEIKWKYDLKACVDCTPVAFYHPSYGILIASGSHANIFVVLNIEGKLISQTIFEDAIESTACITICQNYAIIGSNDSNIYCIEIKTGKIWWQLLTGNSVKSTPVLYDNNRIIFGSYDKYLYCLKIEDGSVIWKLLINESIKSNVVVNNENCYVATIQGTYYSISVTRGTINWKIKTNTPVFGSPCLIKNEDIILWADVKGTIYCFDCSNGSQVWSFKTPNCIYSSIVNQNDKILFNCFDHNVYCYRTTRKEAELIFKINLGAQISSTPCIFVLNNCNYFTVVNNKGMLFLFELETGVLRQKLELKGDVFSSTIVYDNKIIVGCRDNNLYCIEIKEN